MTEFAKMEKGFDPTLVVIAGIAVLALSGMGSESSDEDGGGGGGGTGGGGGGGSTKFTGRIAGVNIDNFAASSQNPTQKPVGTALHVNPVVVINAITASGSRIDWPFQIEVKFGHDTFWGWREAPEGLRLLEMHGQGTNEISVVYVVPDAVGDKYDIKVRLLVAESDEQGNFTSTFRQITDTKKMNDVIEIISASVQVSGRIAGVNLNQTRKMGVRS